MAKVQRIMRDWDGVILDFQASGLSIANYCRKHNISRSLFDKWFRRLGSRVIATNKQFRHFEQRDFVRVDMASQSQTALTIKFPGGIEVAASNDCDAKILSAAIVQLKDISC